jgi:hypothetical protein
MSHSFKIRSLSHVSTDFELQRHSRAAYLQRDAARGGNIPPHIIIDLSVFRRLVSR